MSDLHTACALAGLQRYPYSTRYAHAYSKVHSLFPNVACNNTKGRDGRYIGVVPVSMHGTCLVTGGSEHGDGFRGGLGHIGHSGIVHSEGFNNIGNRVLNGVLAEHGEHSQPTVLALLNLQLSKLLGSAKTEIKGSTTVNGVQILTKTTRNWKTWKTRMAERDWV